MISRRGGTVVIAGVCLAGLAGSGSAAAATVAKPQAAQYLFSIPAAAGSLIGPSDRHLTLRLTGTRDYLTRFTDRPLREAFVVANVDFARRFKGYFGGSNPNAVLTFTPPRSRIPVSVVLTIGRPRWDARAATWTFSATRIRKQPDNLPDTTVHITPPFIPNPRSFTRGTLLIDDSSQVIDGCTVVARPFPRAGHFTACRGMNLSGADFSGLDLTYSVLTSNLSYANLSKTSLGKASLVDDNLTGANLSYSSLAEALLTDADLRNANLTGAYLIATDLTGANLTGAIGADWTYAFVCDTTLPDGTVSNRNCQAPPVP